MNDFSFLSKFGLILILLAFYGWLELGTIFGLSKRTKNEFFEAIRNKDSSKIYYFKLIIIVNKYFIHVLLIGVAFFILGLYL